jgi:hypothetical protein
MIGNVEALKGGKDNEQLVAQWKHHYLSKGCYKHMPQQTFQCAFVTQTIVLCFQVAHLLPFSIM